MRRRFYLSIFLSKKVQKHGVCKSENLANKKNGHKCIDLQGIHMDLQGHIWIYKAHMDIYAEFIYSSVKA